MSNNVILRISFIAVASAALFCISLKAAMVVYEPFDYPAGVLSGNSNTTEVGLSGVWTSSSSALVVTNKLRYGILVIFGNSIGDLNGGSNNFGGARAVKTSALADNGLLDNGVTLWFSLILGYGPGGNMTNARLGVSLANSSFSTGNYDYWIQDEGPQLGSGIGVTLGRISGVNGRTVATQFRDLSAGVDITGNVLGTWEGTGSLYGTGMYHGLIVGKVTWGAGSNDVIQIYQPDTNMNLGPVISQLTVDVDQSKYDTITFTRSDVVVLDEIRFGSSYADVVPVPPAAPAGLTAVRGPVSHTVLLSWNMVGDATGYYVKRAPTNSSYTVIAATANTNYTDYVPYMTNFYYVVSATNSPYCQGPDSAAVMIRLPNPGTVISVR